jgi:hypothetical protein
MAGRGGGGGGGGGGGDGVGERKDPNAAREKKTHTSAAMEYRKWKGAQASVVFAKAVPGRSSLVRAKPLRSPNSHAAHSAVHLFAF